MVGLLWDYAQQDGDRDSGVALWNQLPRDIVYLIVQQFYALQVGVPTGGKWQPWGRGGVVRRGMVRRLARLRPLAAVSSAWRQATVPLLYGAVVCEQSDSPRARAAFGWRTNLRLFAGCPATTRRARQLVVITRHGMDDVTSLCAVLRQAGFARTRWPALGAVQFLAQSELEAPGAGAGPGPGPEASLGKADVCAYVVSCLGRAPRGAAAVAAAGPESARWPTAMLLATSSNACRVDLRRSAAGSAAAVGAISASFPQLPATISVACELTALAIPFGTTGPLLGAAAAATLTDLRLLAIPSHCVWDVLDPEVPFPCLRALDLQFLPGAAPPPPPHPRLADPFPRLRRLALADPPVAVRECLRLAAPGGRLVRVAVETSAATAHAVAGLDAAAQLPGARALDVACIGAAPIAHGDAEMVARQVLRTASATAQHLRLSLATRLPVALDGLCMQAERLQTLELRVPVALAQVAPLLQQLPSLWKLKLPYVSTAELPATEVRSLDKLYAQMAHPPAPVLAKPLSRSVQIAHIGFWDYRQSTRALCCHLLHFALRLPALQTLVHDSQSAVAMQSAVHALALMHQRQARWAAAAAVPTAWLDHLCNLTIMSHDLKI
ncbi:hypothetical protein H4R19_000581 [Coemansia spiralis]|nr:hypothetical protein H4R19_000581 [Coemansia spiralis]